jgi:hypothetical protein
MRRKQTVEDDVKSFFFPYCTDLSIASERIKTGLRGTGCYKWLGIISYGELQCVFNTQWNFVQCGPNFSSEVSVFLISYDTKFCYHSWSIWELNLYT